MYGNAEVVCGVCGLLHVKVQEDSPGGLAGLEAYFDYIISVSDVRLVSLRAQHLTLTCSPFSNPPTSYIRM